MTQFGQESRNRVQRVPKRASYDRETVFDIVDQSLIGHVGFVSEGQPFVIPTLIARDDQALLLHGASTSRLMRVAGAGEPLCVTITHVDGIVLARSAFHHSINYRSAVLFGRGELLTSTQAKMAALARFTDRLLPGRWDEVRKPNDTELKATAVVRMLIESASAKIRVGPPVDDETDYALPVWAGVCPCAVNLPSHWLMLDWQTSARCRHTYSNYFRLKTIDDTDRGRPPQAKNGSIFLKSELE